jgi:hypothetical protein
VQKRAIAPRRRIGLIVGALFILATVTILLGTAIEQPALHDADWLSAISVNANRVAVGGLLELIAAGASVAIALAMYPLLRNWSIGLAIGAVAFRTVEAVMYTVAAVLLLSLLTVSQQFAVASGAERVTFQAIGESLLALREAAVLAGVFAFCTGALMYYVVLYRFALVPRWLSGWGIGAVLLMLLACMLALFSRAPVTSYTVLAAPIAVQEMALAAWLLVKGFQTDRAGARRSPGRAE